MKWYQIRKQALLPQVFFETLAESLEGDGLRVEFSDCMDDIPKLFVSESVIELLVDVVEFLDGEFSSFLKVIQAEVGSSSFFAEWVSFPVK